MYILIVQYNPLNRYQKNVLYKLPLKILRIRFLTMQQSTPRADNTGAFIWEQNFTTIYFSNRPDSQKEQKEGQVKFQGKGQYLYDYDKEGLSLLKVFQPAKITFFFP